MIFALALACATISITDGDTFRCDGQRIRISGIDTPEMDGRCPSERLLAIRARTRLGELLRGEVRLTGDRRDRYGRLLRQVWVGRRNIGQQMIREGHARPYRGRRETWC